MRMRVPLGPTAEPKGARPRGTPAGQPGYPVAPWLAALPVIVCFNLPLTRIGGIVYLYDLLTVGAVLLMRFPGSRAVLERGYARAWTVLLAGIFVGYASSVVRAGFAFRPAAYTAQYLISMTYALSLVCNMAAGRLDPRALANWAALGGVLAALVGIVQYALIQINPGLANDLYLKYLQLSNYSSVAYEKIGMVLIAQGRARITGGWPMATSYGGVVCIGAGWVALSRLGWSRASQCYTCCVLAAVLSLSRHAWIGVLLAGGLLAFRTGRRRSEGLMMLLASIGIGIALLSMYARSGGSLADTGDMISGRFQRTVEQGMGDSSIEARYVSGTARFWNYALEDPTMLLVGVGSQVEVALRDLGVVPADQLGYVSNSWLLAWRNWGLAGFLGLLAMHWLIPATASVWLRCVPALPALIILADNYAAHSASAFMVVLSFAAGIWGLALAPVRAGRRSEIPLPKPEQGRYSECARA